MHRCRGDGGIGAWGADVAELADRIAQALLLRADEIAECDNGSLALRRRNVIRLRHFAGVILSNDAGATSLVARLEALDGPTHPLDLSYAIEIAERPELEWSGTTAANRSVAAWLERVLEHQLPQSFRRISDETGADD